MYIMCTSARLCVCERLRVCINYAGQLKITQDRQYSFNSRLFDSSNIATAL